MTLATIFTKGCNSCNY